MAEETTSDLLHGHAEIGAFLRMSKESAKHRCADGTIPTFKIGRIVCARRSTLNAWLAEREAAARKPAEPIPGG